MGAIKPQPGEYWMTEKGGVVLLDEKRYPDGRLSANMASGTPWPCWKEDGRADLGWDRTRYGNLTHRVNPDGTPWKAAKARKEPKPTAAEIEEHNMAYFRKEAAKWRRLATRMSLAPSIREARKIYNNSVKGEK